MSEDNGQEPRVQFSVKELLARIEVKVDGLNAKLDSKVDVAAFKALEERLADQSQRITDIREDMRVQAAKTATEKAREVTALTHRAKLVAGAVAVAAVAIQIPAALHYL